ncbi:hypothetical protein IWX88_002627 [Frigoribacterium sp. CG_9.8]|nr:hypothetical protein [Frigoribacterium sp. CG_9.8]
MVDVKVSLLSGGRVHNVRERLSEVRLPQSPLADVIAAGGTKHASGNTGDRSQVTQRPHAYSMRGMAVAPSH